MSLLRPLIYLWIVSGLFLACQSENYEESGQLRRELTRFVRVNEGPPSAVDPRPLIIKSMGYDVGRRLSVLHGKSLKTVVELSARTQGGAAFDLVDISTTHIDIEGSWIHSIETTLNRQDEHKHSRVLGCLHVDDKAMIKRASNSWIQFQPAHIYDQNCLDPSLNWLPQLIKTTQTQNQADFEVTGSSEKWQILTLSRLSTLHSKAESMPSRPFNWDLLLGENEQYFSSMLARYGTLISLKGRLEFHSDIGSIRSGEMELKYSFSGKSAFTMTIKIRVQSLPFLDRIKQPEHRLMKPRASLKPAYEKLTGYEFNRPNLILGLQPSHKEPKVLPASKRAPDTKR
ncbi:MAG: hypothetical protein CMH52_02260 [Myxococcales bacterium]|nr:hypothetical protein [Myxococcales bacterium]